MNFELDEYDFHDLARLTEMLEKKEWYRDISGYSVTINETDRDDLCKILRKIVEK